MSDDSVPEVQEFEFPNRRMNEDTNEPTLFVNRVGGLTGESSTDYSSKVEVSAQPANPVVAGSSDTIEEPERKQEPKVINWCLTGIGQHVPVEVSTHFARSSSWCKGLTRSFRFHRSLQLLSPFGECIALLRLG